MEEKVWVIQDPEEKQTVRKKKTASSEATTQKISAYYDKSPAVAFSLSMVCWGAGQFYNRQHKLGSLFVLLMVNFIAFITLSVVYWKDITYYLNRYYLTSSDVFFVVSVIYFFGILIWFANALQAYHRTQRKQKKQFPGVESTMYPMLGSLCVPGWGQVLNGQVKKAYFYLIFAVFQFMVIPLIPLTLISWSALEPSITSIILEIMFCGAVFSLPLLFVVWLISVYDAMRVSADEVKKESWWNRMKYARNRVRLQGFSNTVIPQLKLTLLLSLVLAGVLIAAFYFFPGEYFKEYLSGIQSDLAAKKMVIIPHLIDKIL